MNGLLKLLCFTLLANLYLGTRKTHNPAIYTPNDDCWGISIVQYYAVQYDTVALSSIIGPTKGKYTKQELLNYLAHGKFLERGYKASYDTGIPVSILLAQTILESDMGHSSLTIKTGNRGNIKCRCNRSEGLRKKHSKLAVCVRGYDKIEKSNDYYVVMKTDWQDWSARTRLLNTYGVITRSKNKNLTWREWATVLHKSHYATDVNYDRKLISIIKAYNLSNLDLHYNSVIASTNGKYIFYRPFNIT